MRTPLTPPLFTSVHHCSFVITAGTKSDVSSNLLHHSCHIFLNNEWEQFNWSDSEGFTDSVFYLSLGNWNLLALWLSESACSVALWTVMSVGPPLWPGLKYLTIYWTDCHEIWYIYGSQTKHPNDFGEPQLTTFPSASAVAYLFSAN